MAFLLAMLMFSLAGIPPLAGFFAKFYVFLAAIKAGLYTLAVIGVVTSVVGAYYYLPIVKIDVFRRAGAGLSSRCRALQQAWCWRVAALFNLAVLRLSGAAGRARRPRRRSRCSR